MRAPIVEVRDLEVRYGGAGQEVRAVDGLSLVVPEGGLTAVVGPSGCGKTSLLRAIAGFEVPAAGEVWMAGEVVAGPLRWVDPEDRRVGMVFQQGALFPHLTVAGNVGYGLRRRPGARERAAEVLRLVGLEELAGRFPDELSGGQQQRVALARALAPSPRVVLLDEPFASLDAGLRARLREEVREILERAGTTALLVTHDQEEALSIADRVVVMDLGRVIQEGTPDRVYRRPATAQVARFLGDGQLLECEVRGGLARSVLGEAPVDGPEGRGFLLVRPEDVEIRPDGRQGDPGVPGVVARRRFFGHDLVDDVRLDATGETVQVRSLSNGGPRVGDRVRLRLRRRRFPAYAGEPERCEPPTAGTPSDPGGR
jgi:iron(III) transport system ATP-binding protein